jgi:hypothetical protein
VKIRKKTRKRNVQKIYRVAVPRRRYLTGMLSEVFNTTDVSVFFGFSKRSGATCPMVIFSSTWIPAGMRKSRVMGDSCLCRASFVARKGRESAFWEPM